MNFNNFINEAQKETSQYIKKVIEIFFIIENLKLQCNKFIKNKIQLYELNKNDKFCLSIIFAILTTQSDISDIFEIENIFYNDFLNYFNIDNINSHYLSEKQYERIFTDYLNPIIDNIKNDYIKINNDNILPENIIYSLIDKNKCNSDIIDIVFRNLNYIKDDIPLSLHNAFLFLNGLIRNNQKIVNIDSLLKEKNIEIYNGYNKSLIENKYNFNTNSSIGTDIMKNRYMKLLNCKDYRINNTVKINNLMQNLISIIQKNKSVIITCQSEFMINSIINDLIYLINNHEILGFINTPLIELNFELFLEDLKNHIKKERIIKEFIKEIKQSPAIFYIHDIQSLFRNNIVFKYIKSYINDGSIQIIGNTTEYKYNEFTYLRNNIKNYFEKLEINKLENIIEILLNYINNLEKEKNIIFNINQISKENILNILIQLTSLSNVTSNIDLIISIFENAFEYAENKNSEYLKIEDINSAIQNCEYIDKTIKDKYINKLLDISNNSYNIDISFGKILKFPTI